MSDEEDKQKEQDERVRRGIQQTFSPDWTRDVGKKLAEKIKGNETANKAAQYVGGKLVDYAKWTQKDQSGRIPQVVREPMEKAQAVYMDKAYAEQRRRVEQEIDLTAVKDKIRRLQAIKDASVAPTDGGEIDEPSVRQPVSMSREFASTPQGEEDKKAYIARKAVENAKKKQ